MNVDPRPKKLKPGRDFGRLLARLFCGLFAVIGALPLAAALLARSEAVRSWAAAETARILEQELGVAASYRVEVRLFPLELALRDLTVPSADGKQAFLRAETVAVRPRIFSLLAGRLDAGDIEIDTPTVRAVVKDGQLANLNYRLPKSSKPRTPSTRAPFSSVAMTDAELEIEIDGITVKSHAVDLDVYAENGPSFDIAVRTGQSEILRLRQVEDVLGKGTDEPRIVTSTAKDDDIVCRLEARVRIEPKEILVRRLSVLGVADQDPKTGTLPSCARADDEDEIARVALRASQLRVVLKDGDLKLLDGHAVARVPAFLGNRFARMGPLRGYVGFVGDVHFDGTTKMPELRGKIRGKGLELERYKLMRHVDADVEIAKDRILIPRFEMGFADGLVVLKSGKIEPFAPGVPIQVEQVEAAGMAFEALMRDLGVTPNTIVKWDLKSTKVTKISGTIDPLKIDSEITGETRDFEVFDRAYHDPRRKHMLGVRGTATIRGKIGVRPDAFELYDIRSDFGKSSVLTNLVSIGFHNDIELKVAKSQILLADISPLIDIPMAGHAELSAHMSGKANDPELTGEVKIQGFEFGGFPLGDIQHGNVRFRPLKLDLTDVYAKKGISSYLVTSARLDFESGGSLLADASLKSQRFDLRDFMGMWHFDKDPRFDPIHGEGGVEARIRYDLGGHQDRCGGGYLRVDGSLAMKKLDLFDERYDSGDVDFDFRWADRDASYLGFELDAPSITLKKGNGTLLGSINVQRGGIVRGHVVGTAVPLSKIDAFGTLGLVADGRVSAVAEVSGSLDELRADTAIRVTPVRIGNSTLPASDLKVKLVPIKKELAVIGKSRCGQPITTPFEPAEYHADRPQGVFHIAGELFGGQLHFQDFQVTRQRAKTVRGDIAMVDLDLGAAGELSPGAAIGDARPTGRVTGQLHVDDLALEQPAKARARLFLSRLDLAQAGVEVKLAPGAQPIAIRDGRLDMHGITLAVKSPRGQKGMFDLQGSVQGLGRSPEVDAVLALRPTELAAFSAMIPRAERVKGTVDGKVRITGPVNSLRYRGGFALRGGEIFMRGMPAPVSNLELALDVDNDELRISRGSARIGSGTLSVTGNAPLRGFELGAVRMLVKARELGLPLQDGIKATVDADLVADWRPPRDAQADQPLPRVTGDITLRTFEYTRPVTMTADISSLAARGRRTTFESYDPDDDFVEFEVKLRSNRNLRLSNNLIEAELELERDGLLLGGTNQRFGLRGTVKIKPGGRIRMRQSEFEIRQGHVRFDDHTRIAPQVDVTAVTDYRRYTESSAAETGAQAEPTTSSSTNVTGGRWHITMHAYGDADKLRIDLTSEPALAQDDIFLLLTVGLTRAELDQAQSASVGESVALEALGTLTGADRAVKSAVPLIDDVRFGSAYSSRTGRTEPTVTIGKRLAERIRANVTSGLADSREVRSNVEWRLSPRVSVEGSYDNVNDISSSSLGNLGADVRWRLEFE